MSEWQPIETAPYNTPVLVVESPVFSIAILRGDPDDPDFDHWEATADGQEVNQCHSCGYVIFPTHWMPLPEPPEVSDET